MPYDDPSLKEFAGYIEAKEPGRKERAEAWATAFEGVLPSAGTYREVNIRKHEWVLKEESVPYGPWHSIAENLQSAFAQEQAHSYVETFVGGKKKVERKGAKKTKEKLLHLLREHPHLTIEGMAAALGICRSAVQKHLKSLKESQSLRRIGPDKGGRWEAVDHNCHGDGSWTPKVRAK